MTMRMLIMMTRMMTMMMMMTMRMMMPMTMTITMMMNTKVTTAELGLPASFIICKVEDELQQLYLQVFDTEEKRVWIKKKMNIYKIMKLFLHGCSPASWPSTCSPCSS